MFAVVRTGGKQYRVAPGDKIVVEKMDGDAGDQVTLDDVLLAGDGSDLKSVDGLNVAAEIVAQAKGDKVTVFKKRRRQNYRRKKGHRQQHTILRIVAIGDHKAPAKKSAPKAEASETEAKKPEAKTAAPAKKADAPAKTAKTDEASEKPKKAAAKKPATKKPAPGKAEKASTKNAAPAKGGAKKAPAAKTKK